MLLIVAENKITQETIRRDFESLGCKVIPALTAKSAWHSIGTGPLPDLIILDFVLSDEDGPTFFRRLSLDKRFSSVPSVSLSSSLTDELIPSGIKTFGDPPTSPIEITSTPYTLLFSVAYILNRNNVGLPTAFKVKLRDLNRQNIDGQSISYHQK